MTPVNAAELYRPALLGHARSPRHCGTLASPPALRATGANPRCGDALELFAVIEDGRFIELRHQTRACSVCTASASLLCDTLGGRDCGDALAIALNLRATLASGFTDSTLPDALIPLNAFLSDSPRHRCALLPWQALIEILELRATADSQRPMTR